MQLEPGNRVGPYEVLFVLGSGGMGTVYAARDTRLDRRVALKFLQPAAGSSDTPDTRQRLIDEARAASALNHPNVCQVYDVGGEADESWIAMEFVEGRSLASLIAPSGLPVDQVIHLGAQIAHALAHAHSRGILHRDLKSANIACDAAGRPKILDFGIARRLPPDIKEELTHAETVPVSASLSGTLAYMAPEVVRGESQDERSDLWSLGVVFYEMLTGGVPFKGRNVFDLAASITGGAIPRLPPDVPSELTAVVNALLSRDPRGRPPSAEDVAATLDRLAAERQSPRQSRRALVAFLALAAGAAIVAYAWWPRSQLMSLTDQRLLSTIQAAQRSPSYSPDGTMLAYIAPDAAGIPQVWLRRVDQSASTQITQGPPGASRPRWLPLSNHIVYARAGDGIWSVSPLGGAPTRLLERGTNPNVSRDGKRLVFEDRRSIWTAAVDGTDVQAVKGAPIALYNIAMGPALSPDGSQIAFFHPSLGPNGDFWIIPAAGGAARRLTSDLRDGGWPVWTADGQSLVFSSARGGSRTLWQMSANGGEPQPLTTGAGEDDQPDLSADGRHLTYTNVRNIWQLRVRNLRNGEERTLIERGLELLFPMFSPDGRRIAYFGRADYAVAIFTIGGDGSDLRQLTAGRELNHQPRWGADSQDIYFFQQEPTVSLRRIPAVGGASVEFRTWDWQLQTLPFFDPTGRSIVYLRQRPPGGTPTMSEHTVIHDVATGQERVWPEPHTHPTGWSPDGSMIVGWQHEPQPPGGTAVVICRVAEETCRRITSGQAPKWTAYDGRVYFMRPQPPGYALWSIAPDGTDERRLVDLGTFRSIDAFFDVSRDGLLAYAPYRAGHQELWTAAIK